MRAWTAGLAFNGGTRFENCAACGPARPVVKRRGVGRTWSASASGSRPASLGWLWGGMRTKGIASERFSHRLQRRLCRSGLGGPSRAPVYEAEHTPAPRRALRGTGAAGDAHLAPRERSHHGRDRSMPSSVSFGASKECGGRKSPMLYIVSSTVAMISVLSSPESRLNPNGNFRSAESR